MKSDDWRLAPDAPAMKFARYLGLLGAAPDRVSHLLISQLYQHAAEAGIASVASRAVIEIKALEGVGQSRGMKGLQPFTERPLRGLFKAHYVSQFLPSLRQNLLNEMRLPVQRKRLEAAIHKGQAERGTLSDTVELDKRLSQELSALVARQFWADRLGRGSGTGDWIVVAQHDGQNFYLTTAHHREGVNRKEGDAAIRARIDRSCVPQFPFLADILAPPE